ncbi:MFS transporter [Cellvibrio japonicus]|uniref:Metabolite transport protein-like protein n=1 Tax=Cellvibrio japonicus (strain Ueda107) TaxID=498211 RepID=B3PB90_CELJU|nr:MFS transporter [Cellvibrio japonicus]ACE82764.1 metabolite transport protein-like protein [Cellvibrio japonicus Ueda107]QEI11675.1 MFS transporter [Cellvibrio japonicus]QEI15249.1 MFS transporter [Cellvibrio japonicus]QEI18829.1 MFS transporter [Cellvibrio japonicus]
MTLISTFWIYRNAVLLGLCQFLLMASAAVGISYNGLVGQQLAQSTALATFPFLSMTATTALLTLYLPAILSRLGYQRLFLMGAILGVLGSLLAALAVWQGSFVLFCTAGLLLGSFQASALYYRFAAADSVAPPHKSTAIAWVLNGGILAALLGPIMASHSLHWFAVDYLGSYLAVALLVLLALPVLAWVGLPARQQIAGGDLPSLAQVFAYPYARAAIIFCAGSYAMMMLVMLASPLAMSHCGFEARDAASVIQWHLLGMFAPSLLTGKLIARYGALVVAFVGAAILILGCIVALLGLALTHFHWALMLVGVGWNLMYMGGSTLVTQVPEVSLRARLQSINEFVTFAVMTLTAGTAGVLYQELGWALLLQFTILVVVIFSLWAWLTPRHFSRVS